MTETKNGASVVIIGGGVTGLSTAWWLARGGVDVLVLEKGIVGWEASGRNGGGCTHPQSPLFPEEQRLWPQMDELLGYPTEHQQRRLKIVLHESDVEFMLGWVRMGERQGFGYETLDGPQIRELAPLVGDAVERGYLLNYGGHAIRDLIVDGVCSFADLSTMRLDRFAGLPKDWREAQGWLPPVAA